MGVFAGQYGRWLLHSGILTLTQTVVTAHNPECHEDSRGRYLCEVCFDAMTDVCIPAVESGTGLEMAWCGCKEEEDA